MDDLLFFGPDLAKLSPLKKQLSDRFCIRDIGAISWYLGMEANRDRANQTLFIDQTAFIDRMLKDLWMKKYKSAKVPIDSGTKIVKSRYKSEDYKAAKKYIPKVSVTCWQLIMAGLYDSFGHLICGWKMFYIHRTRPHLMILL